MRRHALATATLVAFALAGSSLAETPSGPAPLRPLPEEPAPVELAPYMAELQVLTHKLSLSVGAGNRELARFYGYESRQLLGEIQRDVPEYRRQPIAVLIDRMSFPALDRLDAALADDGEAGAARRALDGVVASCNQCHRQTLHGFIRITVETERNPFNQDFRPKP